MKRLIGLLLVCAMLLCPIAALADGETAPAGDDVIVEINGNLIEFDVPPQIMNDRTMVPMRKIFETLGVEVTWLEDTQQILAIKGEDAIVFQIDVPVVLIHNFRLDLDSNIELDQAPVIIDDRTLVPIRAVSESLGATVDWIEAEQKVVITKQ